MLTSYPTGPRAARRQRTVRTSFGRLASWATAIALCFAVSLTTGCGSENGDAQAELSYELTVEPDPPRTGLAKLQLRGTDAAGEPVEGAALRIEGNMNHAGMVPEFADATESQPGHYEAELEFTMGGDWILTVEATTADGRKHEWQRDVRGVLPE